MLQWHDGSYLSDACDGCDYINVCGTGCRSASKSYFSKMDGKDPLFVGPQNIKKHFNVKKHINSELLEAMDNDEKFVVRKTLRFREENGFYVVNVRWADVFTIESYLAEFLIEYQISGKPFSLKMMTGENPRKDLITLVMKEAVLPVKPELKENAVSEVKTGCSLNPEDLPDSFWENV